jgi:hypothetical protein
MNIRQLALHYRPETDRILLRVNSNDGQQFAVWFTRRLCLRLWPHLASMVTKIGVAQEVATASPDATVMPEAQAMLAQSARERALRQADFKTPFDEHASARPLGAEPMLAAEVQLMPLANHQLRLVIIDADKRHVQLQLTEALATAVKELMGKALLQADWGFALESGPPVANDPAAPPRLFN